MGFQPLDKFLLRAEVSVEARSEARDIRNRKRTDRFDCIFSYLCM